MNPFAPRPVQPLPHYYGLLRPSALHRYSHTQDFSLLCFSLGIKATGSRSAFSSTLTTFALNKRRLRRFEACSRKPASRGLPSSSIELMSPPCDATAHLAQNQGLP